jgi:hypothetical protein
MLIAGIIVVAAVGIVVVVSVLTRKKTDVNPNKIDVKKRINICRCSALRGAACLINWR